MNDGIQTLRIVQLAVTIAAVLVASPPCLRGAPLPGPLVGAYYYPWYYAERWTREPVSDTPQLGNYSSGKRDVAAQHIRWAKQADIDFFIVSWLSPDGRENQNFRQAVLPELAQAQYRFSILYETSLALGLPAGKPLDLAQTLPDGMKAGDRLVSHFDYLAENYLNHPCYLKLDGRAVVTLYLVRDLANAGPFLQSVRERLGRRGIRLYLVADAVYWQPPGQLDWGLLKQHFQAVTAYNMHYRPQFLDSVRGQFRAMDRRAHEAGLRLIPNVMPGYDDTPLRGAGRATLHRRQGRFYTEYWNIAREFVTADQPFVFITSFNEWHEGTEVEPSKEYGDLYLTLTRQEAELLRKPKTVPPSVP
jgi:hypothetical protein